MNYPAICIHIWLHSLPIVNCLSLLNFSKSWEELSWRCGSHKIRLIPWKWFRPSDAEIFQGWDMSWWQVDTLIVFVGFLSRDVLDLGVLFFGVEWVVFEILSSATPSRLSNAKICQGSRHELLAMGHLDHMCWVSKIWWFRFGSLGFGCWLGDFWKSVIFNIIVWGGNLILMQHMVRILHELVKLRVKFLHFLISIILVGINQSLNEDEPVIQTWHLENLRFCVCAVVMMCLC